jgi:hypothetical protein
MVIFEMYDTYEKFLSSAQSADLEDLPTVHDFFLNSPHINLLNHPDELWKDAWIMDQKIQSINAKIVYFRKLLKQWKRKNTLKWNESQFFYTYRAEIITEMALLNMFIGPTDAGLPATERLLAATQSEIVRNLLHSSI